MPVTKQTMPALVQSALPEFFSDIIDYLDVEEPASFSPDDFTLDGYYSDGATSGFVVFTYPAEGETGIAVIRLNPQSRSFDDAAVFSWGREGTQTMAEALDLFLTMHRRA